MASASWRRIWGSIRQGWRFTTAAAADRSIAESLQSSPPPRSSWPRPGSLPTEPARSSWSCCSIPPGHAAAGRGQAPIRPGDRRFPQRTETSATFDMNFVHVEDFKNFSIPFDQYASVISSATTTRPGITSSLTRSKKTVIDWLDPKPITYQNQEDRWITFEGYLPK